jgi:hypothetical protein
MRATECCKVGAPNRTKWLLKFDDAGLISTWTSLLTKNSSHAYWATSLDQEQVDGT